MPLLLLISLLALPFAEIWVMIVVGQQVGVAATVAALFLASAAGVLVVRQAGSRVFRDFDEALRTGAPPGSGLPGSHPRGILDPLMLMVGGILMVLPGFVTGALGLFLALPFTRPALRWVFEAWARRRMERMRAAMAAAGAETVHVTVEDPSAPRTARPPGPFTDGEPQRRVVQGKVVEEDDDGKR